MYRSRDGPDCFIVCQATGFFPSIRFFWVSLSTPLRYTISELTTYNEIKLMSLIF